MTKKQNYWLVQYYITVHGQLHIIVTFNLQLHTTEHICYNCDNCKTLGILAFFSHTLFVMIELIYLHTYMTGLIFIGMITLVDPPRPEVFQAIQDCNTAGK